jgi:hypothetical protein
MAALSGNRIAWTYTDDLGRDWRVAAQKALTDQSKLGGSAAAITVPPKPASIHMRRTTVRAVGTGSRSLPCYAGDAAILTAGETVNANFAGNSVEFTSAGTLISERRPRQSVTAQST